MKPWAGYCCQCGNSLPCPSDLPAEPMNLKAAIAFIESKGWKDTRDGWMCPECAEEAERMTRAGPEVV